MDINAAFPSKYLKCEDLQGRPATIRMGDVVGENIDGDNKMILYFLGKKKGLVLNKTNGMKIAETYGNETADWYDQLIELYPAETDYAGKTVPCIRVRAPSQARTETRSEARPAPPREAPRERAHEPDRISSGLDRGHDREVDDAPRGPPPRQASRDMNDDIPF